MGRSAVTHGTGEPESVVLALKGTGRRDRSDEAPNHRQVPHPPAKTPFSGINQASLSEREEAAPAVLDRETRLRASHEHGRARISLRIAATAPVWK